jgi:hypothetical protein
MGKKKGGKKKGKGTTLDLTAFLGDTARRVKEDEIALPSAPTQRK